ncbi:hypothetical protein DOT_5863 [Desulfosporosinus sp. OT]|nr:hypothetical protein DOT_5863 [Desulfosporosinus sp. OT]
MLIIGEKNLILSGSFSYHTVGIFCVNAISKESYLLHNQIEHVNWSSSIFINTTL